MDEFVEVEAEESAEELESGEEEEASGEEENSGEEEEVVKDLIDDTVEEEGEIDTEDEVARKRKLG